MHRREDSKYIDGLQSLPRESNDKDVAAMLDELTIEADEESFVIVLQHGGNDVTYKRSIKALGGAQSHSRNFKEVLSVLLLCAPVLIFTSGSSAGSFRVPMLWFIDLTVATCHIQYALLSLCQFFHKKTDKTQLEVRHTKMAADGY